MGSYLSEAVNPGQGVKGFSEAGGDRYVSDGEFQAVWDKADQPPPARRLRPPTVIRLTGLGHSTLYRMIANHQLPSPVRIGCRAVAWRQADFAFWIDDASRRIEPARTQFPASGAIAF